jgi:hypothetical protein
LSNVEVDRQRNIQLMKERSWLDVPIVYGDGRRAILAIEKATLGAPALAVLDPPDGAPPAAATPQAGATEEPKRAPVRDLIAEAIRATTPPESAARHAAPGAPPVSEIPKAPIDHSPTEVSVTPWPVVPSTSLEPKPKTETSPQSDPGKPKLPKVGAVLPQVLPRPELKLSPPTKATFAPPPQYDHVPSVKVIDRVTTQDVVEHWCRDHGVDRGAHYVRIMGCAWLSGDTCLVSRIDDGTVRRHEYAHCNGWRHE